MRKPEIGQIIDKAMIAIENENESLKGVLPKEYARPALDKEKLGDIIDLFTFKVGDTESRKQDVLGRVYEYFIANSQVPKVKCWRILYPVINCKVIS